MYILRGYGLGPKLQRLIHRFWDDQVVVPKARRLYGRTFRIEIVANQGYLVSPAALKIVMDAMVREVLLEACRPQE